MVHGDVLTRNGRLLERKASSQGLDVGVGAGPERFFDSVGDFRFAAVFESQCKELDGETAYLSFAHGFLHLLFTTLFRAKFFTLIREIFELRWSRYRSDAGGDHDSKKKLLGKEK